MLELSKTLNLLQDRFQLGNFRPGQYEIIHALVSDRDVLAVLPTGGGKSLCYQFIAVLKNQLVIVISPLIALMKDQVAALSRLNIPAGCLHFGQPPDERRQILKQLGQGGTFVLYLSPERAQKDEFKGWLDEYKVALFAVDEAHCVSQWGHDFRAEYSQLDRLKKLRPEVPILALTASATPLVLKDISRQLNLKSPVRQVHGFYRPNLYYQVEDCENDDSKFAVLLQALRRIQTGRALIYCATRRFTEELAGRLSTEFPNIGFYHAGLRPEDRSSIQTDYALGKLRVLVATNAFGMGINLPDIRLVAHFQMPANIDSLYQEMGRAGRDGQESLCLMLYAKRDRGLQAFFIRRSRAASEIQDARWRALESLIGYAESRGCRHAAILSYFCDSHKLKRCGHCDICSPQSPWRVRFDNSPKESVQRRRNRRSTGSIEGQGLSEGDEHLFQSLRLWRKERARQLDAPAYVVFSDSILIQICRLRPSTLSSLRQIPGIGEAKLNSYGSDLLALVRSAQVLIDPALPIDDTAAFPPNHEATTCLKT